MINRETTQDNQNDLQFPTILFRFVSMLAASLSSLRVSTLGLTPLIFRNRLVIEGQILHGYPVSVGKGKLSSSRPSNKA